MRPEFATISAAIIGGLVAYFVARQTAARTLRTEIVKLQVSTQSASFVKLLEARLECYPELFSMISRFIRTVATPPPKASSWAALLDAIDAWDVNHAILLGPGTINDCWRFRTELRRVVDFLTLTPDLGDQREQVRERLYHAAEALELALRSDLGIYGVEGADHATQLRTPRVTSYDEPAS